jgi:hypothetical protein
MIDIIHSIKDVLYKMFKARGYQYKESTCRVEYIGGDGIVRNLEVVYTIKEYIPMVFPPHLKQTDRYLIVNQMLKDLQGGIDGGMEVYICDGSKRICSICNWHLEDYYECQPCNPCGDNICKSDCRKDYYSDC